MKVCIVTSSYPQSENDPQATAGLFVQSFAAELARQNVEVHVLTYDRGLGASAAEPAGVRVSKYAWRGGNRRASYLRPYKPGDVLDILSMIGEGRRSLRRLHDEQGFEHVFAMWAALGGYLARDLWRAEGVPYSVWCLGSDIWVYGKYPFFRRLVRSIIRDAREAYADGYQLADDAQRLSGRQLEFLASSRKLDLSLRQELDIPQDRPNFLCVGRYHRVKGIDVLLEAFAAYRRDGGRGHLFVFGGGPEEEALRARAAQVDLVDCVEIGGYADERTIVSYLAACGTAVIPSRNESIPVVLSDALQTGTPVIATDVGDMGRVVRELDAGWVVPAESVDSLCRALHAASEGPKTLHQEAVEHFDISRSARRFLKDVTAD